MRLAGKGRNNACEGWKVTNECVMAMVMVMVMKLVTITNKKAM